MDNQLYEYSGKTWKPCMTEGSGNCFFHAAFGDRVDDRYPYEDKKANCRRAYWSAFLKYFQNEDMPSPLADFLERCFVANDKDIERDYEEYVRDVALSDHWVLVEEIPILATIDNIKIVLFMSECAMPDIFEPRPELLDKFPHRYTSELRTVVMRHRNSHYERLLCYRLPQVIEAEAAYVEDFSKTIYTESKKYKKAGSAGMNGQLYQINLLTVLLLKGLTIASDWSLSTENTLAGNKFDDAVFEYYQGHVLIQAKHKENEAEKISFESLMQSSYDHPLNIAKYLIAFQEIRNRFDIKQLVICTNVGMKMDERLKAIIQEETVSTENILFFKNAPNVCYTFTENVVPRLKAQVQSHYAKKNLAVKLCISEEDIRCFLSLLRIFTNYLDEENLENVADEAVSQIPLAKRLDPMQAFNHINDQVTKWFLQESESPYLRTYEAKAFFCEKYSLNYVDILKQYELTWEENHLPPSFCQQPKRDKKSEKRNGKNSNCGEDLKKHNKQVLHVVPQHVHILSVVKVFQALQKQIEIHCVLFVNPSESSVVQQHIVEAFAVPHYVYLVIASPRTANKGLVQRIMNILRPGKNHYKKVIVVADANNEFATALKKESLKESLYELKTDVITFDNFSAETAANLRRRNIVFQGSNISLEDVTGGNSLNDIVDGEMLARLSKLDENIVVGNEMKHLDENIERYYIARSFKGERQFSEEEMCQSEERVVLISDTAGMGKSTVLTSLAIKIKARYPHLFVICIDLNNYSKIYRKYFKEDRQKIDLLELLNSEKVTELKSHFEKRLFRVKSKVVLMMDAMDEVNPSHKNMVVSLLEDCRGLENIARIFVTTRPLLCHNLEKRLELKAYSLQPFSEENQVDFLTSYWAYHLNIQGEVQKKRCRCYAKVFIKKTSEWMDKMFARVPLQTRMLAEVFQERASKEMQKWEGCGEFLLSREERPSLPNRINLIQLYEMFIEKKRSIFVNDKCNPKSAAEGILTRTFNDFCDIYRAYALAAVLKTNVSHLFRTDCDWKKKCDMVCSEAKDLFQTGILQQKGEEVYFIHRTFAEYYTAECLLTELNVYTDNLKLKTFFHTEVMLQDKYHVVRAFLDGFMDRNWPPRSDDTLEKFSGMLVPKLSLTYLMHYADMLASTTKDEVRLLQLLLMFAYFSICFKSHRQTEKLLLVDVPYLYMVTRVTQGHREKHGYFIIVQELRDPVEDETSTDLSYGNGNNTAVNGVAPDKRVRIRLPPRLPENILYVWSWLHEKGAAGDYVKYAPQMSVRAENFKVVKFPVQRGRLSRSNVSMAANCGGIVKLLVEEAGIGINTIDGNQGTAQKCLLGKFDFVDYLVQHGCATFPFDDAIRGGNVQLVLALLKFVGQWLKYEDRVAMQEFADSDFDNESLVDILMKIRKLYFRREGEGIYENSNTNDDDDADGDEDDDNSINNSSIDFIRKDGNIYIYSNIDSSDKRMIDYEIRSETYREFYYEDIVQRDIEKEIFCGLGHFKQYFTEIEDTREDIEE